MTEGRSVRVNYQAFFFSLFLSRLADQVLLFLVPVVVFQTTQKASWAGIAFFIEAPPRYQLADQAGVVLGPLLAALLLGWRNWEVVVMATSLLFFAADYATILWQRTGNIAPVPFAPGGARLLKFCGRLLTSDVEATVDAQLLGLATGQQLDEPVR
jgi:hypothetical protein